MFLAEPMRFKMGSKVRIEALVTPPNRIVVREMPSMQISSAPRSVLAALLLQNTVRQIIQQAGVIQYTHNAKNRNDQRTGRQNIVHTINEETHSRVVRCIVSKYIGKSEQSCCQSHNGTQAEANADTCIDVAGLGRNNQHYYNWEQHDQCCRIRYRIDLAALISTADTANDSKEHDGNEPSNCRILHTTADDTANICRAAIMELLRGRRCNRSIRDRGKVVTKHSAGNNAASHPHRICAQNQACRVKNRKRNKHGSNRGTGRRRDNAGCQKSKGNK